MNITIFTDGSSRGNPGPGGWGAIIISKNDDKNEAKNSKSETVTELGGAEQRTTNNRMELTAVIRAIEFVSKLSPKSYHLLTTINTDSSYVLNSATKWVHGWQKNNWKTKLKDDVLNKDLWEEYIEVSKNLKLEWNLLKGHSGIPGNERCDEIATAFADLSTNTASNEKIILYKGPLSEYKTDISSSTNYKQPITSKKSKSKSSSKKAFSYVSEVNGVVMTHKTWAECEARVKGKSKAKFKKSFSPEDEKSLVSLWKKSS